MYSCWFWLRCARCGYLFTQVCLLCSLLSRRFSSHVISQSVVRYFFTLLLAHWYFIFRPLLFCVGALLVPVFFSHARGLLFRASIGEIHLASTVLLLILLDFVSGSALMRVSFLSVGVVVGCLPSGRALVVFALAGCLYALRSSSCGVSRVHSLLVRSGFRSGLLLWLSISRIHSGWSNLCIVSSLSS